MPGSISPGNSDIMIPTDDDEKNVKVELFGRNEAKGAEILGWTNNILLNIIEPKEELRIKTLPLEEILSLIKHYKYNEEGFLEFKDDSKRVPTLLEMSQGAIYNQSKIGQPLLVTVVEKKSVDTLMARHNAKIICKIIVADDSGFCILTGFNDLVDSLYNQVNIGDRLVICKGEMKMARRMTEMDSICLNRAKFIDGVEIKLHMFDSRLIYRIQSQARYSEIPENFDIFPEKGLWSPNELFMKDAEVYRFPRGVTSINVCGVISYVGRISRIEIYRDEASEVVGYSCFRWIQLIDEQVKKPLSVKLWLNNISWLRQKEIVPGSAVVLTNVHCDKREEFWDFHLVSSPLTSIYVNKQVTQFLGLLPEKTLRKQCMIEIRKISQSKKAVAILSRRDIPWMIGGTLHMKITDVDKFINFYKEACNSTANEELQKKKSKMIQLNIPPSHKTVNCPRHLKDCPLARREEQRLYIKGFIYKIFVVSLTGDFVRQFDWSLSPEKIKSKDEQQNVKENNKFDGTKPPLRSLRHDDSYNWFSYRRKLPQESTIKVLGGVFRELEGSSERYLEYCPCLLMPSDSHSASKLKELPIAEEGKSFELFIADTVTGRNYRCKWNTYSFEAMKARLHVMKKKKEIKPDEYVFVLNVHRIENPIPKKSDDGKEETIQEFLDIQLIDFVEYHGSDPEESIN